MSFGGIFGGRSIDKSLGRVTYSRGHISFHVCVVTVEAC